MEFIWHGHIGRRHNHYTAECRHFQFTTAYSQSKIANKSEICQTCLVDAHPLSQCSRRRGHRRCNKCHYTHSSIIKCCPHELRRTSATGNKTTPSQQQKTRNNVPDISASLPTQACSTSVLTNSPRHSTNLAEARKSKYSRNKTTKENRKRKTWERY